MKFFILLILISLTCGANKSNHLPDKGYGWKTSESGITYAMWDKKNVKCPIMGGDAQASLFFDYKEYRYFFCCAGCPEAFKKDPESFISKGAVGIPLKEINNK